MKLFRITSEKYSHSLTASGVSSRWNKDNQYVLYTSQSRALSTLENLAHLTVIPNIKFKTMVISLINNQNILTINHNELPQNWQDLSNYPITQNIGSNWYINKNSLILKVPSSIIPQEFNYIINTSHPDFQKNITLSNVENYCFDKRLI